MKSRFVFYDGVACISVARKSDEGLESGDCVMEFGVFGTGGAWLICLKRDRGVVRYH